MQKGYSFGALAYDNGEAATAAQEELRQLERDGELVVKDDALVQRSQEGELKLEHRAHLSPKSGSLAGGSVGLLLGLALGGPIGGAVVGAETGHVAGALELSYHD